MASINLDKATVEFSVYTGRSRTLKNVLFDRTVGGRLTTSASDQTTRVVALDEVTLSASPGERIGIVGHNGAGKSTLLRVLGRIYPPTSGSVEIKGSIATLIDLALGMEMDDTGLGNIYVKGTLLGLKRQEIDTLVPEIVEFSELGDYIHLPVRTYSSGMRLRLAFGISTAISPDIAIFDEVIGVGDIQFHSKAKQRLDRLIAEAKIVFICSHDTNMILNNCSRVLWMDAGRLIDDGPAEKVVSAYLARSGFA
jgi:ABC-type polysaccharide/polyol phosphate transport system ATPase subunit